jgi:multimeric flavodoxin WrbA
MSKSVCLVFHSGYGHTEKQARAIAEGIESAGVACELLPVAELSDTDAPAWSRLDAADAIVFGGPTYMGSVSAALKQFMEASSGRWQEQRWANKLAAGFTNSGSQNGDKQNTLIQLLTFAAQHGMLWINLNQLPGNNSSGGSVDDINRLGASLGAMAQSNVDAAPDVAPGSADLATARQFGTHIAECVRRWN